MVRAEACRQTECCRDQTCGDLRARDPKQISQMMGSDLSGLIRRARGIDPRPVIPDEAPKSISAETTFENDLDDDEKLAAWLEDSGGKGITPIEGKITIRPTHHAQAEDSILPHHHPITDDHGTDTHGRSDLHPRPYVAIRETAKGNFFRLIGIGVDMLEDDTAADPPDLADPGRAKGISWKMPSTDCRKNLVMTASSRADVSPLMMISSWALQGGDVS